MCVRLWCKLKASGVFVGVGLCERQYQLGGLDGAQREALRVRRHLRQRDGLRVG